MQDALLVLETSCAQSSAAAWGGKELLCRVEWRAERNHSSAILRRCARRWRLWKDGV